MPETRRETIRRINRASGLGALWRWARNPGPRGRMRRFRALREWAANNAKQARQAGHHKESRRWAERRDIYAERYHHSKLRWLDSKEREPPPTALRGTFDGKTVCGWMIGTAPGRNGERVNWLQRSRDEGWDGYVVSGVRTPEYSEQLCYAMCGAPSCPGRCAGRASNHNATTGAYPQGAIDVSDYANFEAIQTRIGSPLINRLDARDPVHFSVSGV